MKENLSLNQICWCFTPKTYTSFDEFNKEVINYQKSIGETDEDWKPDEVAIDSPELQIQYRAWITGPSDLLENETLIDDYKSIFDEELEEDEYPVEIIAKFKADNGKNFTTLEFLIKLHNQQANKELGDHVFFKGIDEPEIIHGIPTYYIACGS
ncbi:hypothetical protein ETU08_06655 [Apibacter muscae]|uniref:hypothetical protein n=1 Tax=Apibacter muscae TaxID=2509004 RepID=UPI0011AD0CCF|nr:hypothetical protein [Apibacter muscae]TWP29521.1 hypothetical protein ETU08_06655 [Apibacter muscae]